MTDSGNNKRIRRILDLLFKTGRILQEHLRQRKDVDVSTHLQMHALHCIDQSPGITMRQLALAFHIAPASATALANRLIRQKLIERIPSQTDRRTIHLRLTAQGQKAGQQHLRYLQETMAGILDRLPVQRQDELINILQELILIYNKR